MDPSPFHSQQIAVLNRQPDSSLRVDLVHTPRSIEHDRRFEHNAAFAVSVGYVHVCRRMVVEMDHEVESIRA
jgi:hypothetical protein